MKVYIPDHNKGNRLVESELCTAEELKRFTPEELFRYMREHPYCIGEKIFSVDSTKYADLHLVIDFFENKEDAQKDISNFMELHLEACRWYKPGNTSPKYVDPQKDTEKTVLKLYYTGMPVNFEKQYIIDEEIKGYVI